MARHRAPFKNALCLEGLPELSNPFEAPYLHHLSIRVSRCQRRAHHAGEHRSWLRTWKEGDKDSRRRADST